LKELDTAGQSWNLEQHEINLHVVEPRK
jgi:hypothetical protein